jgi:excisionase family DNA binding protein
MRLAESSKRAQRLVRQDGLQCERSSGVSRPVPCLALEGGCLVTTSNAVIGLPELMTVEEVADFLRTTVRAVYDMIRRAQLPPSAIVRPTGTRRILLKRDEVRAHVGL